MSDGKRQKVTEVYDTCYMRSALRKTPLSLFYHHLKERKPTLKTTKILEIEYFGMEYFNFFFFFKTFQSYVWRGFLEVHYSIATLHNQFFLAYLLSSLSIRKL